MPAKVSWPFKVAVFLATYRAGEEIPISSNKGGESTLGLDHFQRTGLVLQRAAAI